MARSFLPCSIVVDLAPACKTLESVGDAGRERMSDSHIEGTKVGMEGKINRRKEVE